MLDAYVGVTFEEVAKLGSCDIDPGTIDPIDVEDWKLVDPAADETQAGLTPKRFPTVSPENSLP